MNDKFSFKKGHRARAIFLIFDYLFLILLMIAMLVPLWKIFVDSIDPTSVGARMWPKEWSLDAYRVILNNSSLYRPFLVSVFTTIAATVIGLAITTLGAYALMQKDMPGHAFFSKAVLITMMFSVGMIATYLTYKNLGLMNNLFAIVLSVSSTAYNTILMRSFFDGLPKALFEAATIDGCSKFACFYRIALPLSKPALASVGLFIGVAMWNDYMHFVLYVTDLNLQNFQVKIRALILEDALSVASSSVSLSTNMLKSATIFIVIVPFMLIYPFIQKYFTKGVTLGAVKG